MFLRYDKMCVTLLTELDDGRYVIFPATVRYDGRYVTFLQLDETTIGSISRNDRTTSFQIISAKLRCSVKCDANSYLKFTFDVKHYATPQLLKVGQQRLFHPFCSNTGIGKNPELVTYKTSPPQNDPKKPFIYFENHPFTLKTIHANFYSCSLSLSIVFIYSLPGDG